MCVLATNNQIVKVFLTFCFFPNHLHKYGIDFVTKAIVLKKFLKFGTIFK